MKKIHWKYTEPLKSILKKAILPWLILFLITGWIHEVGHSLVCAPYTDIFNWVGILFLHFKCPVLVPVNFIPLYWALGGVFGMIASFSLLLSKKYVREKHLMVAVLTNGFTHFGDIIFETYKHESYLNNGYDSLPLLMAFILIPLLGFSMFFVVRTKNKP